MFIEGPGRSKMLIEVQGDLENIKILLSQMILKTTSFHRARR
jgi:hypothetical protein